MVPIDCVACAVLLVFNLFILLFCFVIFVILTEGGGTCYFAHCCYFTLFYLLTLTACDTFVPVFPFAHLFDPIVHLLFALVVGRRTWGISPLSSLALWRRNKPSLSHLLLFLYSSHSPSSNACVPVGRQTWHGVRQWQCGPLLGQAGGRQAGRPLRLTWLLQLPPATLDNSMTLLNY